MIQEIEKRKIGKRAMASGKKWRKAICYICRKDFLSMKKSTGLWTSCCSRNCGYRKNSIDRKGKNNPNWKGDNVGYNGLHSFVKNRKGKPNRCDDCKNKLPLDLANISGNYLRELDDWEWLCRKCHMHKDGRISNLKQYAGN